MTPGEAALWGLEHQTFMLASGVMLFAISYTITAFSREMREWLHDRGFRSILNEIRKHQHRKD